MYHFVMLQDIIMSTEIVKEIDGSGFQPSFVSV